MLLNKQDLNKLQPFNLHPSSFNLQPSTFNLQPSKKVRISKASIKALAKDMGKAYNKAVKENLSITC